MVGEPMSLTEYEKYIRTEELLALQKAKDNLNCHDEMQFQVIHQVAELWMKLIGHESERLVTLLQEDRCSQATGVLRRIEKIWHILIGQLDLLDTMAPTDYMKVREGLGRGSGQESPGFRLMLRLPGEQIWPAFHQFLENRSMTLLAVYKNPEEFHEVFQIAEGLVDYDQLLQTWRYRHLILVYRIIGAGTPSLKGKPSELLAKGMRQRFFPELWEARDQVFSEWTQKMASKGKDPGYHG